MPSTRYAYTKTKKASVVYLSCTDDTAGYRFGFNSMPKDNEIYGPEGSGYDFGARIYDSRLGRWLSVDPLADEFPWQSPYCAMGNNPIVLNDPTGMAAEDPKDGGGGGGTCPTCPNGQKGDVHYTNNETGIGANGDMMIFPKGTTQAYVNLGDNQWSLGGFRMEDGMTYNWNAEKSWYTNDDGNEYDQPFYMEFTNAVGNLMRSMVNMATDAIQKSDPFASVKKAKAQSGESWGGFLWKGMVLNITNLFASGYTGQQARLCLLAGMQASGGYMGAPSLTGSFIGSIKIPVYWVYGGGAGRFGTSWTFINPKLYGNSFRNFAGLPNQNSGHFMIKGSVRLGDINGFRPALPLNGNFGRLVPEFKINTSWNKVNWSPSSVTRTSF